MEEKQRERAGEKGKREKGKGKREKG